MSSTVIYSIKDICAEYGDYFANNGRRVKGFTFYVDSKLLYVKRIYIGLISPLRLLAHIKEEKQPVKIPFDKCLISINESLQRKIEKEVPKERYFAIYVNRELSSFKDKYNYTQYYHKCEVIRLDDEMKNILIQYEKKNKNKIQKAQECLHDSPGLYSNYADDSD